ncbi:hypothetical protein M7I_6850 [Glarea lozoyensis 74030]|uniref:Ankyrin repeat-containing protein n=1 Tax=Glarea lozoyensis (strain ATCC 74030 / MF5533) TaxID=1104152 RepID=H0EVP9_GLAL7|nr:hypothetical protein M7I_6850 [Glarea lozoyensis 74030]
MARAGRLCPLNLKRGGRGLHKAGLRHLCHKGPQAEISYVLNNWPPSLGSLSNSPSVYRPAQCSAALAGRIAVLEDLFAHGCPLFNEDGDETVSKAATEGAVRRENTTVLEFLLEKGWDSRTRPTERNGNQVVSHPWLFPERPNPSNSRADLDHQSRIHHASIRHRASDSAGGTVQGKDAVARAVQAHVSNIPGRLEVVECLLDNGADQHQETPFALVRPWVDAGEKGIQ